MAQRDGDKNQIQQSKGLFLPLFLGAPAPLFSGALAPPSFWWPLRHSFWWPLCHFLFGFFGLYKIKDKDLAPNLFKRAPL